MDNQCISLKYYFAFKVTSLRYFMILRVILMKYRKVK